MSKWRRLAIISCTHVFSNYGLLPPSHETEEGVVYEQSKNQQYLWECWEEYWRGKAKDADIVVHLGDVLQGNNRKNWGKGTVCASLDEQKDASVKVLKDKIQGRPALIMRGSGYHTSLDTAAERDIAAAVGAEWGGGMQMRRLTGPDVVCMFSHGKANPAMYKASFEDRESMLLDAAYGSGQLKEKVDFVIKGHWHWFGNLDMGHRAMIRVPGWQFWYPADFMLDMFGKKNNWVGGIVLDIGPMKAGTVQYHVHKYLWPQENWDYEDM